MAITIKNNILLFIDSAGIDLKNYKCFAPKNWHLNISDGKGTYIKVPPIKGEEITKFTFNYLATVKI